MIAAIVLAAGASSRMGRSKMLLSLGEETLLSAGVAPLLAAGVERVVVVLGHDADLVRREGRLPDDERLRVVVNEAWPEGQSSSLRRGLLECGDVEAILVGLGDQAGRRAAEIRRIVEAWRPNVPLVVPVHRGRASHPVLFGRALFDELRAQQGDVGGREVVRRHWPEAILVECDPVRDVDTPQDYEQLLEGRPAVAGEGLERPDFPKRSG
jgi:molybdenum cofactor cytidylyltransferase